MSILVANKVSRIRYFWSLVLSERSKPGCMGPRSFLYSTFTNFYYS